MSIKLFTLRTVTIKRIQDKNTKNSIKSKNYQKGRTLGELKSLTLIDWYIVIMPSVSFPFGDKYIDWHIPVLMFLTVILNSLAVIEFLKFFYLTCIIVSDP